MRRSALLASLALSATLLSSCTASSPEVSEQTREAVEGYMQDRSSLEQAVETVAHRCMVAQGFSEQVAPGRSGGTIVGVNGLFADREDAERGYLSTIREEGSAESADSAYMQAYTGGEDAQTVEVSFGGGAVSATSIEGCRAEGIREIFGSVEDYLRYTNFINEINMAGSGEADQVIRDASDRFDAYATCMSDKGYEVSSLDDPESIAEERFGAYRNPGEEPSAAEWEMAVEDFRCQEDSGIVAALDETYIQSISEWLGENEELVLEAHEIGQQAQKRAVEVVNE